VDILNSQKVCKETKVSAHLLIKTDKGNVFVRWFSTNLFLKIDFSEF